MAAIGAVPAAGRYDFAFSNHLLRVSASGICWGSCAALARAGTAMSKAAVRRIVSTSFITHGQRGLKNASEIMGLSRYTPNGY